MVVLSLVVNLLAAAVLFHARGPTPYHAVRPFMFSSCNFESSANLLLYRLIVAQSFGRNFSFSTLRFEFVLRCNVTLRAT